MVIDDIRSNTIRRGFVVYLELKRVTINAVSAKSTITTENRNPMFSDMKG